MDYKSQKYFPAIVIAAYNRPLSLQRLLASLSQANYPNHLSIPLIISIDHSDEPSVILLAEAFQWQYGPKTIIHRTKHLGLASHILACGDLSAEYGTIIMLEDDLFVSPVFYEYAIQSLNFFAADNRISGISLYGYDFNEYSHMRFIPLDDGYDNYFMQTPSSSGQIWPHEQWAMFKKWYEENKNFRLTFDHRTPDAILAWPESSWKKYYIRFMVQNDKYFVYPRTSLTTNFADVGTHFLTKTYWTQAPLLMRKHNYIFSSLENSLSIYDCFFEIYPKYIKYFADDLKEFDFVCDVNGLKRIECFPAKYALTIRDSKKTVRSYSAELIPFELNMIFNLKGSFFNLTEASMSESIRRIKIDELTMRMSKVSKKPAPGVRDSFQILSQAIINSGKRRLNLKRNL